MSVSVETQCEKLWEQLKSKAPVLRPKIIARGFDDDQLLGLCKTEEQKEALEAALERYSSGKKGTHCSSCREVITEGGGIFASEWQYDFNSKLQILHRLAYLCEACYALTDLEEILPVLAKPSADILENITRFHTINGVSDSSMAPVQLVEYVEQCYSIAFSLKVLLSNFPSWKLVDQHKKPFTAKTNFTEIVSECLAPTKSSGSTPDAKTANNTKSAPSPSAKASKTSESPKSSIHKEQSSKKRSAEKDLIDAPSAKKKKNQ